MKKIIFAALCLFGAAAVSAQTQNYWKPFSTNSLPDGGPISGSINGITIDSANHIYVETGGDGVLQSTDGGNTWQGFNEGLRVLPFQNMASSTFEYDSINHIPIAYVYGISQRNELMRRLFNTKSGDSRWEYLMNIINQHSDSLVYDTTIVGKDTTIVTNRVLLPHIVHAPTLQISDLMTNRKGYLYLATPSFGILRSRTRGVSFDSLPSLRAPVPDSFIVCMAIHRPTQDIYAISQRNLTYRGVPVSIKNWITHLSRSTDDGTTWHTLSTVMPFPSLINKMVVADDGSILLGYRHNTLDTSSLARVFRSTDMGQTWDSAIELPHLKESNVDAMVLAPRSHDIYVNVHGPTFRSTDNGATWTNGNQEKKGEETFHVAMDTNNAIFQVAIPDGCFKSTDNGMTFVDKDSDLAVQHMDGGIAVNSKGTIFACSQFNMYRFPDALGGWHNLTNELDEATNPYFTIDHEDRVFYGSYWGFFQSTDNGDTFDTVIKSRPYALFSFEQQNQVFYHGVNAKDELFVSCAKDTGGLNPNSEFFFFRSKQHGDKGTWERLNNATNTGQFSILRTEEMECFDFSPATGDTGFAAEQSGKLYRTTNDGTNWEVVNTPLKTGYTQLLCYPDGSVFRVLSGGGGNGADGVWLSVDNGVTWTKVFPSDTLLGIPSYSAVKPLLLDRRGRILINTYQYSPGDNMPINSITGVSDTLTKSGFYLSDPTDPTFKTWQYVSTGFDGDSWFKDSLHHLNCSQVAQNKKTGFYYGNSRGRSVFVSTWPDFDSSEHKGVPITHYPSFVTEPVNYPNPFMKSTEISFQVPHSGRVKISLFDVMGRLVKVIANGNMDAGAHTMPFDATAMTSGQYMLLLESGSDRISHWMTITK